MPNKKKPLSSKKLDGNPGKRSIAPKPKPSPGFPAMPDGLSDAARSEWERVTKILDAENRLSEHDGGLLKRHCKLFGYIELCEEELDKSTPLIGGQRGLVKNPVVQIHRNYFQLYLKSSELLGIDPRRRESTSAPANDDPDGLLD